MRRSVPSLLVGVVLQLLLALDLSAGTPAKVGFVNSITGPEAALGENLSNGVTLALEDLKTQGIDVQLVTEDDAGKPEKSMAAFEKMATRDKVAGVVGPYNSTMAAAVAEVAEKYRVPLLIPVAAKENLTKQNLKWVFRLNAPSDAYATVLLNMAVSLGKPATIAIIHENTDFGTSTAKSAAEYAAGRGLKVVANEAYASGSPDHRSALARIKAQNPDLMFMVSYVTDAILLMRQSRELGITPQAFLGAGSGFATEQFAKETEISNYVFSSAQWTASVGWPGARKFAVRYQQRFGKVPTYHAACGYAAMMIMAETAAKAQSNPEKTRELLRNGKWNGIMGKVEFVDYEGYTNQNNHQMLVEQIQNGKHETVYPPQGAPKKAVYPFPGWRK